MELPDPFPNSEVKHISAHDTGFPGTIGHRQEISFFKKTPALAGAPQLVKEYLGDIKVDEF